MLSLPPPLRSLREDEEDGSGLFELEGPWEEGPGTGAGPEEDIARGAEGGCFAEAGPSGMRLSASYSGCNILEFCKMLNRG